MAGLESNEFITLALVVKTQGRHGEVAVELHSDVPGRLQQGLRLFALGENGSRRELKVEDTWPHKDFLVLKFSGIDSISQAESLVGCELQVPRGERAVLEQGLAYVSDLVGCSLLDHGDALSASIAAASILAKVERDRMITQWDPVFPVYALKSNKGYSTPKHLAALREYGPSPLHRQSFAPVWQAPVPQEVLQFMLQE